MSANHLLATPEAAAKLGIAPATMVDWRFHRKGPRYTKIGRLVRYHEQDLHDFLAARLIDPNRSTRGGWS